MSWRGAVTLLLLVGIAGLALAAMAPADHATGTVDDALAAPPAVSATLRGACFDCHSDQTRWPWYGRVAPLSWLLDHDVELGREELNFSNWQAYGPIVRRRKLQWMGRALEREAMPPLLYRLVHPKARLSPEARALLAQWVRSQLAGADSASK